MDLRSIQCSQIKVARTAPAKDKAHLPLIPHAIKEPKAMDSFRRGVALPFSPFPDRRFVQLPVIPPDTLRQIPRAIGACQWMPTDAACIYHVGLLQLMGN